MSMACLLIAGLASISQAEAAGTRDDLGGEASLFIPEGYRPRDGRVDVVLHLHGAPKVVEAAMVDSKWPAVLIVFNRPGLSSAYARPFADRALFPRLLDRALKAVADRKLAEAPRLGRVTVSSFSAGFGGVRELLKVPEHFDRVDGIVLADSLYSGYEGKAADQKADPALMAGFRAFAAKAAGGSKVMVLTHSAQVPEGYASTTETADDLIGVVGGKATSGRVDLGDGRIRSRGFEKSGFAVLGFEGAGPEDHMRHLRRIAPAWTLAIRLEEGLRRDEEAEAQAHVPGDDHVDPAHDRPALDGDAGI